MGQQILLVAHDTTERQALETYLARSLGYEVKAVTSALEAFESALASHFDLAIISTDLQQVGGVEALRRLRSIAPALQAIFLADSDRMTEQETDYLKFAVPEEHVLQWPQEDLAGLTRRIIAVIGPPCA